MKPATALIWMVLVVGCAETHGRPGDAGADVAPARSTMGFDVFVAAQLPRDPFGLGKDPHLAIDRDGVFHISHVHQDTGDVLYTTGVPGDFRTETAGRIALGPTDVGAASHSIGADGTVHIAYSHDVDLGAVHAQRALDGTWSRRALPFGLGPLGGVHPSVATSIDGSPVFVGTGAVEGSRIEILAAAGDGAAERIGESTDWRALRIRSVTMPDGTVHATFVQDGDLIITTRSVAGAWASRVVEPGTAPSLHAAADGTLHLAFVRWETTPRQLVYVAGAGPAEVIDEGQFQWTSIAVAPGGAVHIAYETPGIVWYATNASGAWRTEEVERVSTQNGRPSIALDPSGRPWIAYREFFDSALVVATPRR